MKAFEPTRLIFARKFRRLTQTELARDLGVSRGTVSLWESDQREPERTAITRLSLRLRFSREFFAGPPLPLIPSDAPSWRARRSMSALEREGAYADGLLAAAVVSPAVRTYFNLPSVDIPLLDQEGEGELPSIAASVARKYWGLGNGPISSMIGLLESKGVEVYWISSESENSDAFSMWIDKRPYVFLRAGRGAGERDSFTCAHELGHLIMHRNSTAADWQTTEREANEFASAFLMPESQFRVECPKFPIISSFLPLKKRWRVSIQAMVRRGRDLGVFSDKQYQQAYIEISRRHMRREEPEQLAREESRLHRLIFERLMEKGVSPASFATQLNLSLSDLAVVVPMVSQFADEQRVATRSVVQPEPSAEAAEPRSHLRRVK